jgi:hypothetical protein
MYKEIREFVEQTIMYILNGKYKLNRTTHFDEEIPSFSLKDNVNRYIYNIAHILIIKHQPMILLKNYEYSADKDFYYLSNIFTIIKFMDLDSQISLDTEYNKLSKICAKKIRSLPLNLQGKIRKKCTYICMKNIYNHTDEYLKHKKLDLSKKDTKLIAYIIVYKL